MTDFQAGDLVRVVDEYEGEIALIVDDHIYVKREGHRWLAPVYPRNKSVKVLERAIPPEPTKIGTVVRTSDGAVAEKRNREAWLLVGRERYVLWPEVLDGQTFEIIYEPQDGE